MTTIVKFMDRRFAEGFITGKSIRVGTLHEFRDVEQHGCEVGDPDESSYNIRSGKLGKPLVIGSATTPNLHKEILKTSRGIIVEFEDNEFEGGLNALTVSF